MLTLTAIGCATTSPTKVTQQEAPPQNDIDPAAQRNVQVVGTETSSADGQTSWIIEPDVRRTPKIAGWDAGLPPQIERRMNYAFDLAQRGAYLLRCNRVSSGARPVCPGNGLAQRRREPP